MRGNRLNRQPRTRAILLQRQRVEPDLNDEVQGMWEEAMRDGEEREAPQPKRSLDENE